MASFIHATEIPRDTLALPALIGRGHWCCTGDQWLLKTEGKLSLSSKHAMG